MDTAGDTAILGTTVERDIPFPDITNNEAQTMETQNRELPGSVAVLNKESIKLFTKFRAAGCDRLHIGLAKDGRFHVRLYASYKMQVGWVDTIPEAKAVQSVRGTSWLMPDTDTFALCVMLAWDDEQIVYEDDAARQKMEVLRAQILLGDLVARTQAYYKTSGVVPQHDLYYNSELPPTSYQQVAAYCAINSLDGYALFMEQGTGKTPVVINVICNECEAVCKLEGRPYRAIIVTPNNVRANWKKEIALFATHPIRATIIRGDEITRVKQLCDGLKHGHETATAIIISYDTLAVMWPVLSAIEWDLAVLDEAHYIKSTRTRRFKRCAELRDRSRKRLVLTGTPVANTPLDLYAPLEFLGKGYSGFATQKGFNRFYGRYRYDPQHGLQLVGTQKNMLPILQERLARLSFRVSKKEALPELPEKVYDIIECEMTPVQAEIYRKVSTEIKVQIEREMNRERSGTMVINNILTMLLKLSQVTSGFLNYPELYDEFGNKIQEAHTDVFNPNPKLDALAEALKDKPAHEKTLVWACYTQDIVSIAERLRAEGIDAVTYYGATSDIERETAEHRFNHDPACRVLIGNASAGGTGLNLLGYPPHTKDPQTYMSHAIYYSQGWSYIHRDQSEARGHRRGTVCNVRISDLVMPNTIDEEIRARVLEKKQVALSLGDLRPILSRVLTNL